MVYKLYQLIMHHIIQEFLMFVWNPKRKKQLLRINIPICNGLP